MEMPLSSPASSSSDEAPSTNSGDFLRKLFEPALRQLERARAQRVAQRALVAQPLHHREPDVLERHAGKFGVQIVRRLPQLLGIDLLADVDRFARNLPAIGHDDDQDLGRAQRNEFDFFQDAVAWPSAARTRRAVMRATAPARRPPAHLRPAPAFRRRAAAALRPRHRCAPSAARQAADRRRTGSRDRSECGRRTYAAAAGIRAPRAPPACCGWWPTTHPDRPRASGGRSRPARRCRCIRRRARRESAPLWMKAGTFVSSRMPRVLDRL